MSTPDWALTNNDALTCHAKEAFPKKEWEVAPPFPKLQIMIVEELRWRMLLAWVVDHAPVLSCCDNDNSNNDSHIKILRHNMQHQQNQSLQNIQFISMNMWRQQGNNSLLCTLVPCDKRSCVQCKNITGICATSSFSSLSFIRREGVDFLLWQQPCCGEFGIGGSGGGRKELILKVSHDTENEL
eukprot:15367170-Ditylum_brightwellii.AAC.3